MTWKEIYQMSGDQMYFPKDIQLFIKDFSFKDSKEIYTNGSDLIPVFRVEQMLDHYFPHWRESSQAR